jgi:NADH:ubiquinone oxidoreductase subunit 5 (subunit L)/multisubunit Na+/H+ antiporter MnhA subunit
LTNTRFGLILIGITLAAANLFYIIMLLFLIFGVLYFIIDYLYNFEQLISFIVLLHFFILSMLILFTAADLILILVAWECIGIFSYFLVAFFGYRWHVSRAALKTFLFARVSDCALLFFLVGLFFLSRSTYLFFNIHNFCYLFSSAANFFSSCLEIALLITILCKSAQFIFFVWLPDAMEAPTPASALIHSSTLVIAGIFLLLKFYFLIILIF